MADDIKDNKDIGSKVHYIIVIHNFKDVKSLKEFTEVQKEFCMSCFNGIERPETVDGISIKWYESDIPYFRHVFLAEEGSEAGKLNAVYFNLIRNWIKEKTMDRKQTLLQIFKTYTKQILYRYLKSNADLKSSIDIDVKILSVNETNSLTIKKKNTNFY